jgi:hypothetical protein
VPQQNLLPRTKDDNHLLSNGNDFCFIRLFVMFMFARRHRKTNWISLCIKIIAFIIEGSLEFGQSAFRNRNFDNGTSWVLLSNFRFRNSGLPYRELYFSPQLALPYKELYFSHRSDLILPEKEFLFKNQIRSRKYSQVCLIMYN